MLFAMNTSDSATLVDRIAETLEYAGYACVVCDYAAENGLDPRRLSTGISRTHLTLSDRGLDSALWFSDAVYQECYGDDIDFPALLALEFSRLMDDEVPSYEHLHPESGYRQQLRGFASRCEELIRAVSPDLVVVQQGGEVLSRIILSKTMKVGIPWLLSETSFLAGFLLLDPNGQHFMRGCNQIDRDWPGWQHRSLSAAESATVAHFVERWRSGRQSKYVQSGQLSTAVSEFLRRDGPLLFVPMQIARDANVHYGLGLFRSLGDFYECLMDSLPPGWRIIFKPHPMDTSPDQWRPKKHPRVLWADNVNIHDVLPYAEAVAVFSSNVGFEALLYGTPVIVGGKPWYGDKGLTIDVERRQDLGELVARAPQWGVDERRRDLLIHYLVSEYLVAEDDASAVSRKLARTGADQIGLTSPRRPFSEADPDFVGLQVQRLHNYAGLARFGLGHTEIFRQLGWELGQPSLERPLVEKDWPIAWVAGQSPKLVSAYALAAELVKTGGRVLDCGCGTGFGAWLLGRGGLRVTATDESPARLAYALRTWSHRRVRYAQLSPLEIIDQALDGQTFDAVLLVDRLSYVMDPGALLQSLWKVVAKGGVLLARVIRPEAAVVPGRACPLHLMAQPDLQSIFGRLPDVATRLFFFQDNNAIYLQGGREFEFQWILVEKQAPADRTDSCAERLARLLPGSFSIATEHSIGGLLGVLARRRRRFFPPRPL
ncbi:MAG: methyltransferase domain-containing protein [Gammaproteobacteria bacterium]|nr:methyltransferase domain-containing protein [Gammaproteobacteria bacterium]